MEGADGHAFDGAFVSEALHQALTHFGGGLVGEGDGGDGGRLCARFNQIGNAGDQRFGFAGAGACDDGDGAGG